MNIALLAIIWIVVPVHSLSSSSSGGCNAAYKEQYLEKWQLSEGEWTAGCLENITPDEILNRAEKAFISTCRMRYVSVAGKNGVAEGTVTAYCSQGEPGEAKLKSMLGLPPAAYPPKLLHGSTSQTSPEDLNPGTRLYNLIRTAGSKLPRQLSPSNKLPQDWEFMTMTSMCAEVYVPTNAKRSVCLTRFKLACNDTEKGISRALILPTEMLDRGCKGLLKGIDFDWWIPNIQRDIRPANLTQKYLNGLFNFAQQSVKNGGGPHQ